MCFKREREIKDKKRVNDIVKKERERNRFIEIEKHIERKREKESEKE